MTPYMFSASDLVKKTAMQLCYERKHKVEKPPTEAMLKGQETQRSNTLTNSMPELRGEYNWKDVKIFFTNDEVNDNFIREHKATLYQPVPDYYFQQSLIQTALYKAFIKSGSTVLVTPTFRLNEGYPLITKEVDKDIEYRLLFGDDEYIISCKENKLIPFFVDKAISSLDWETAKKHNENFKHKEWNHLKQYITYESILSEAKQA